MRAPSLTDGYATGPRAAERSYDPHREEPHLTVVIKHGRCKGLFQTAAGNARRVAGPDVDLPRLMQKAGQGKCYV